MADPASFLEFDKRDSLSGVRIDPYASKNQIGIVVENNDVFSKLGDLEVPMYTQRAPTGGPKSATDRPDSTSSYFTQFGANVTQKSMKEPLAEKRKTKAEIRLELLQKQVEKERKEAARLLAENLERKKFEHERKVKNLLNSIELGNQTVIPDTERKLQDEQDKYDAKRLALFEEWQEKVFGRLQRDICQQVEENFDGLRETRYQLFQEYLDLVEKKQAKDGQVFRDIVLEAEYNPFKFDGIKTCVDLDDPLTRDSDERLLKKKKKRKKTRPSSTTQKDPLDLETPRTFVADAEEEDIDGVRPMLPLKMWHKLEATPYYDRLEKVQKQPNKLQSSSIKLDMFTFDREAAAKELKAAFTS
ncbi:hypothetical protein PCE1_003726 [Barthelona sp. PCE]